MNKVFKRINKQNTLTVAAFVMSMSFLASRLLGLLRDRLLATHFGISPQMDAYTAAFRIPELLFTLLVSGAFAVSFIPIFTQHLVKEEREEAWELTSNLLNILVLGTIALSVIIYIFAGPLTTLVTPGFDHYRHQLTVGLTRIMLITPVCFAISSVLGSVQQAFRRFAIFGLASVFYNVGIIFGIIYLVPNHSIYGVAWGVVIGAALQAVIQVVGLIGLGYKYEFKLNLRLPNVRKVIALMIPRSVDQGMDQINYMAETVIGSRLSTGSLTSYYYANNLKNVPMSLVGTAITTAVFPRLSAHAASGQKQALFAEFDRIFKWLLYLTLPTVVVAVVLRGYIVRLLFGFSSSVTANTLGWFAGTILSQTLFFLIARVYFALQDTKTPVLTGLVAIIVNVGLSYILSLYLGVIGLAMATSISTTVETLLLLEILRRRERGIGGRSIVRASLPMVIASGVMTACTYLAVTRLWPLYAADRGFLRLAPHFLELSLVAAISYVIPCWILRVHEQRQFLGHIRKFALKTLGLAR